MRAAVKGRAGTPEGQILKAVLQFVAWHPRVAWAERMNTGAVTVDSRYLRFGFTGCPDIIGQLKDGRLLAIECKAARGRLTPSQAAFLARCEKNLGVCGVARSIEDAKAIIEGRA
jgi:hypothetical protein